MILVASYCRVSTDKDDQANSFEAQQRYFKEYMLGYDVKDGKLSINRSGAELVRLIFHKYGVEQKGTSIIAREMREAGYQTLTGNTKWNNSHIVKILKNVKYVGDLVQKKTYTPDYLTHQKKYNYGAEEKVCLTDHHEAIIDRELWNIVQAELQRRNRHGQLAIGHGNRYVFSGKIRCGLCGAAFVARKKRYPNGTVSKKWGCFTATNEGARHIDPMGNSVGCDIGTMLRDDFATEILKTAAGAALSASKWVTEQVTACTNAEIKRSEIIGGDSAEKLEYEIQQITKKKESTLDAFFSKDITKEEMRLMNERYDRQMAELESGLQAAREREQLSYETATLKADVKAHIGELAGREVDEPFCKSVLDTIIVNPGRRLELRLNLLPQKWRDLLDSIADIRCRMGDTGGHYDPSVPISVSRPFSSSKGME